MFREFQHLAEANRANPVTLLDQSRRVARVLLVTNLMADLIGVGFALRAYAILDNLNVPAAVGDQFESAANSNVLWI